MLRRRRERQTLTLLNTSADEKRLPHRQEDNVYQVYININLSQKKD